jgi:hypothetical protein
MKDRHQYYLDNKEHIKAKTKEYYLKHKNDDDFKASIALKARRYRKNKKEKEKFYKEFQELKSKVLYLEALLGINNKLTT